MGFYRNSENEYICEFCNVAPFINIQDAIDHVAAHNITPAPSQTPVVETIPMPRTIPMEINNYYDDLETGGTMQAAERLMMSLIEDYTLSRNNDLRAGNKISPMTLQLGKSAAEAMNTYNKLKVVNKSVNVNVDASKKSDIDALKEMLNKKEDDEPE